MRESKAWIEVTKELNEAQRNFPPMRSAHEGLAIIQEEFEELKQEVFWGEVPEKRLTEAKQLAAMAIRFLIDVEER